MLTDEEKKAKAEATKKEALEKANKTLEENKAFRAVMQRIAGKKHERNLKMQSKKRGVFDGHASKLIDQWMSKAYDELLLKAKELDPSKKQEDILASALVALMLALATVAMFLSVALRSFRRGGPSDPLPANNNNMNVTNQPNSPAMNISNTTGGLSAIDIRGGNHDIDVLLSDPDIDEDEKNMLRLLREAQNDIKAQIERTLSSMKRHDRGSISSSASWDESIYGSGLNPASDSDNSPSPWNTDIYDTASDTSSIFSDYEDPFGGDDKEDEHHYADPAVVLRGKSGSGDAAARESAFKKSLHGDGDLGFLPPVPDRPSLRASLGEPVVQSVHSLSEKTRDYENPYSLASPERQEFKLFKMAQEVVDENPCDELVFDPTLSMSINNPNYAQNEGDENPRYDNLHPDVDPMHDYALATQEPPEPPPVDYDRTAPVLEHTFSIGSLQSPPNRAMPPSKPVKITSFADAVIAAQAAMQAKAAAKAAAASAPEPVETKRDHKKLE